jgi:hypothetical protein
LLQLFRGDSELMSEPVVINNAFRLEELHDAKIHCSGFTVKARVERGK